MEGVRRVLSRLRQRKGLHKISLDPYDTRLRLAQGAGNWVFALLTHSGPGDWRQGASSGADRETDQQVPRNQTRMLTVNPLPPRCN